jgi:branched-chain amino acid transport system substrate-binding protein
MQNKNKLLIGILIVTVFAIVIVGLNTVGLFSLSKNNNVIKIGVVYPMTGNAAAYGEYAVNAFRLAVENINKDSDLKIEAIYEDGKCNGKDAVSATNKLIEFDNVDFLIGFCTGEVLAMAPIAEQNKKILFAPGATGAKVGNVSKFVFRNIGNQETGIKKLVPYLISQNINEISSIAENTDFAQSINKSFQDTFTNQGGKMQFTENFNSDNIDFKTMVFKLKNANVKDIFIITQSYKSSLTLLKEMKEQNYKPNIYASDSLISAEALEFYKQNNLQDIIEGTVFITLVFDEKNPLAQDLLNLYKDKYGSLEGPIPKTYLATYYDSAYMIKDGVINVGKDPEKLLSYFSSINWNGASGNIVFDDNRNAIADAEIKIVKNGEMVSQ